MKVVILESFTKVDFPIRMCEVVVVNTSVMYRQPPSLTANRHGLHGTTTNKYARVVHRRVEKVVKNAEFVLDLPHFDVYLTGLQWSQYNSVRSSAVPNQTTCTTAASRSANESIISSDFNENGITGKIMLSERASEYCIDYEASLRMDQVGFSMLHFNVKALLCGDKNEILVESEWAFVRGNPELCVKGNQMRIPFDKLLGKLKESNLTFRIVLSVKAEIYKQPKPHSFARAYGTDEETDPPFLKPLQNRDDSDVQIICEGEAIPVHGFILKNVSSVFRRMLELPMKEATTRKIVIEDLGVDTVKRMVDYIYHGRINFGSSAQVVELLYAAEKYAFDMLKTACLKHMVACLSDENFTLFLQSSDWVNAGDEIIKQMMDYCNDRIRELRKRKDFQDFARKNPKFFLENFILSGTNGTIN